MNMKTGRDAVMDDILTLIGSYAFPIVMCVAFFWYITVKDKSHREEVQTLDSQHQETYKELRETIARNTEALNNMNLIITKLVERMDK